MVFVVSTRPLLTVLCSYRAPWVRVVINGASFSLEPYEYKHANYFLAVKLFFYRENRAVCRLTTHPPTTGAWRIRDYTSHIYILYDPPPPLSERRTHFILATGGSYIRLIPRQKTRIDRLKTDVCCIYNISFEVSCYFCSLRRLVGKSTGKAYMRPRPWPVYSRALSFFQVFPGFTAL